MSSETAVLIEKRGSELRIILNRPDKRNAINQEVIDGVRAGYERARSDDDIRVIVLTAAGDKAFCAGADLQPGKAFTFDFSDPNAPYADLFRLARETRIPSIARVNGVCMAGGMGLLCMADLAVAADDVQFGLPEVKVGVFPMQVLSLLQPLVPARVLREWCYTGEPFSAEVALRHGLINYAVPREELDDHVAWLANRLVDKSPTAIRWGKNALHRVESMAFEDAIAFTEAQIANVAMSEDAKEGLAAFNEKRKPQWTGR